jgi:hypothetical protein
VSTFGTSLTLYILAICLLLFDFRLQFFIVNYLIVIDLIVYQIILKVGLGTLPNVLIYKLFPMELRGFVSAIVVIFDVLIGFAISKFYEMIMYTGNEALLGDKNLN